MQPPELGSVLRVPDHVFPEAVDRFRVGMMQLGEGIRVMVVPGPIPLRQEVADLHFVDSHYPLLSG
jgi:hypothetical protein